MVNMIVVFLLLGLFLACGFLLLACVHLAAQYDEMMDEYELKQKGGNDEQTAETGDGETEGGGSEVS